MRFLLPGLLILLLVGGGFWLLSPDRSGHPDESQLPTPAGGQETADLVPAETKPQEEASGVVERASVGGTTDMEAKVEVSQTSSGPAHTVEVRLTYHEGSPAGRMRVALIEELPRGGSQEVRVGWTEEDGIVALDAGPALQLRTTLVGFSIQIGIPASTPIRHVLPAGEPLPEKIEITLPPLGTLQVHTRQADGQPFPDGTQVLVQALAEGRRRPSQRAEGSYRSFRRDLDRGLDQRETRDGVAQFVVALDHGFKIGLVHPEHHRILSRTAAGPTLEQDRVSVTLRESSFPSLTGRFLLPDGQPLAHAKVETLLKTNETGAGNTLTTDADGRFLYPLGQPAMPEPVTPGLTPSRVLHYVAHAGPGEAYYGNLDLTHDLPAKETSLGDITLSDEPLVGGTTVTSELAPIAEVELEIKAELHANPSMGWVWFQKYCTLTSDQEGRFALYGQVPGSEVQVIASRPEYDKVEVKLETRRMDHFLILDQGSPTWLRILLPEGLAYDDLELLISQDSAGHLSSMSTRSLEMEGDRMRLDLTAGEHRVDLIMKATGETVFRAERVMIGGGAGQDPRLDPIDLRHTLVRQALTVLDAEGQPLKRFSIRTLDGFREERLRSGEAFWATRGTVEFLVWSEGSASRLVRFDGSPMTLTLGSSYPIRITLDGIQELGVEGIIEFDLYSVERGHKESWKSISGTSIEAELPQAGPHVLFGIMKTPLDLETGPSSMLPILFDGEMMRELHLEDKAGIQEFVFQVTLGTSFED